MALADYLPSSQGLADFFGSITGAVKQTAQFAGDLYGQYATVQNQVSQAKLQTLGMQTQMSLAKQGLLTQQAVANADSTARIAQANAMAKYATENPTSPFLPFTNAPSMLNGSGYNILMLGLAVAAIYFTVKK